MAIPDHLNLLKMRSDLNLCSRAIKQLQSKMQQTDKKLDEIDSRVTQNQLQLKQGETRDSNSIELIKEQEIAIDQLKKLNDSKDCELISLRKWIIVLILGLLSLSARYEITYRPSSGPIVQPKEEPGFIIPTLYTIAIIATATDNNKKLGQWFDKFLGGTRNG